MSVTENNTHRTYVAVEAPIGTLLDRLRLVSSEIGEKQQELGQIEKAIIVQRAAAINQARANPEYNATNIKMYADNYISGFSSEAAEISHDIEALKEEKFYIHAVLKYRHDMATESVTGNGV